MTTEATQSNDNHGFLLGLVTGSVIGAGLAMLFAPRTAREIGQRVASSARTIRDTASERYEQASTRVVDAVDEMTKKGQRLRDEAADAVVRGAREVERFATDAKTGLAVDRSRKHPSA